MFGYWLQSRAATAEFPLPDDEGRRKLVTLYARGLEVPATVMDSIVRRTKGVSPAFIKELMRRAAPFQIEQAKTSVLQEQALDSAIEEMVFAGGALNVKLLGASAAFAVNN
jgi:ATP-dependent 26S proteasome regulatory subunit